MPKYPRQSACAVIAFGFTFVAVFLGLYLAITPWGRYPGHAPDDLHRILSLLLAPIVLLAHTFAFLAVIRIRHSPKRLKGGTYLTGTLVIIGMVWLVLAVMAVVAVVKVGVEVLGAA